MMLYFLYFAALMKAEMCQNTERQKEKLIHGRGALPGGGDHYDGPGVDQV